MTEKHIKQIEKKLAEIQDKVINREPLTDSEQKMLQVDFKYSRRDAAKIILKNLNHYL